MEMWDGYLILIACAGSLAFMMPRDAAAPRYAQGGARFGSAHLAKPRIAPNLPRI